MCYFNVIIQNKIIMPYDDLYEILQKGFFS